MRRKSSNTTSTSLSSATTTTFSTTITNNLSSKDVFIFQNEIPSEKTLDLLPAGSESEPYALYPPVTDTTPSHRHLRLEDIHSFWAETMADLKSIRWRRFWGRFLLHIFTLTLLASLIWFVTILGIPRGGIYTRGTPAVCSPNGDFHIDPSGRGTNLYDPWKGSGIFAIDIQFGMMDFSTAKGVDILWDLGFGRGMQGILTIISYKACTKALSRLMERTPVPLRSFEAITLQSDSITGLMKLLRDALQQNSLRARLIVLWIATSTVILLAFQSLASAMTGYTASIGPFIQIDSGDRVPAVQFQAVQYIIHDGSRLKGDFYDEYPVTISFFGETLTISAYNVYTQLATNGRRGYEVAGECWQLAPMRYNEDTITWKSMSSTMDPTTAASCLLLWHISEYTATYGFLGLNATNSTFNDSGTTVELPSPALNISAHFGPSYTAPDGVSWAQLPYGYYWTDPEGQRPFSKSGPLWAYGTNQYNLTTINKRGTCQQQDVSDVKYRWGFSSVLCLVFCVIMFIWVLGTYSMYLDAYFNSKLEIDKRDIGLKRAVLDVHTAMQRDLDELNTDHLGNSKLRKMVKNNRLDYTELLNDETHTRSQLVGKWRRNFDVKKWFWDEKWWLFLFVIFTIMLFASVYTRARLWWYVFVSPFPVLSTLVVLIIGRGHKSRWITFLVLLSLLFLIPEAFFLVGQRKHHFRW